jgi:predicted membrane-bound spermidine synthase
VNGQGWGLRLLWGFVCAFVGALLSVVLAIIVVFATPAFHINWPLSHGLVLLIVICAPILIGALIGFEFPRQAQVTASGAARGLANAYRINARRRH